MRPVRLHVAAVLVLAAGVVGGCARASTPSGGDVPETPLRIVGSEPEALSVVAPFDGPVRFEFQRRVSERPASGRLRDAVVVSPRTGEVEVRHRSRGLEVRMEGGFPAGSVYRITVLPVLQDLFQNAMDRPYELFFSTGPDFEPNVLGGLVADRLTGAAGRAARIDAAPLPGGPAHSTVADSTGIFAFPYLPAGAYRVVAWDDLNGNRRPDFSEPQDSARVELARGDTLIVTDLALLLPDTTAAVLQSVRPVDSLTVRLAFDDPLDPEWPLDGVRVSLAWEEGEAPGVSEVLHVHEWERRVGEEVPEGVEDPAEAEPAAAGADPAPPLPARELIAILRSPLEPGATYSVTVSGVRNLNGVPGGGGQVSLEVPEPPG